MEKHARVWRPYSFQTGSPICPTVAHRVLRVPEVCDAIFTGFSQFFFARKSTFSFVDAIAGQRESATGVICPLEMRGIEWGPLSHNINPCVISFGGVTLAFVYLRCRLSCSRGGRTYFCSEGFHLHASVRSRL